MARRLGTILVDMGYLDEDGLWKVLEEQKRSENELIGKVAVRLGLVREDQVLKALGEQLGMKVVKLADMTIPPEVIELVNQTMAEAFKVVPVAVGRKDKAVTVAMAEPQNPSTLDSLRSFLGVEVKGSIAAESEVLAKIEELYAGRTRSRSTTSSSRSSRTRTSPASRTATRAPSTWRPSRRWPRPPRSASS